MCKNTIHNIIPPNLFEYIIKNCDEKDKAPILKALNHTYNLMNYYAGIGSSSLVYNPGSDKNLDRIIYDAKNTDKYPGTKIVRTEGSSESRDISINEAYEHLGITYQFYKEIFGRNSIDNKGLKLVATVHYLENYANAFWADNQMVFGDGMKPYFNRFTSCIDVTAHEMTHGVTQYEADLDYAYQAGALNESISDVFGIMVKQFSNNQKSTESDWLIGQGIFGPKMNPDNDPNLALRSFKNPGAAYSDDDQVGHMDQYEELPFSNDNGGVHKYSGIPNKAFYLLATDLGGYSWDQAGKIWYNTLTDNNLSNKASFDDFAKLTVNNANKLFGKSVSNHVTDAWNQVGVLR
ncbi:M4 family metallopeptidase [Xenorhabdus innexi]|uniref:Neutral metalloproteinase n=1 Tax=Xenorhabdus innexi TaxID=290109 RepID=A0A1N6MVF1_9GAMM|nr:M4 family metallopeptidase [Xenorhabdus innexi]PHM38296.1 zinc metalloproteinase aureolysin [Xenorhabdus innexi]SIP72838.1 Protease prtS [Xenorhabdus innexi]